MFRFSTNGAALDDLLQHEWLTTNGVGGFASSTLACMNTRKYHGLLVASMSPPARRMVLLSRVEETIALDGWTVPLASNEYPGAIDPQGHRMLAAFRGNPYPSWAYQAQGWTVEKGLRLLAGRNTVLISYALLSGDKPVTLELRPMMALRPIHELMYQWNGRLLTQTLPGNQSHRVPPTTRTPEVFFAHDGEFKGQPYWYLNTIYRREQERGYAGLEDLWSPGVVRWTLTPGQTVFFACSTDPINLPETIKTAGEQVTSTHFTMPAPAGSAHEDLDALRRAAKHLLIIPPTDAATDRPPVAADFPWSAPNLRDTMIAFPGLLLVTGKFNEARTVLRWMAGKLDGGVMPSELPESGAPPVYQGADTSLWFINAVQQYLRWSNDEPFVHRYLFESMIQVVQNYRHGTGLGISTDTDGLLQSRQAGLGTSWMDAKHLERVVTPRGGRPVELNALWYNALQIVADLSDRFGQGTFAKELHALAAQMRKAFNDRFWNAAQQCLFDVVDDHGNDASIRPNQLFSMSLAYSVLTPDRAAAVLAAVKLHLLTPMGLRTLSPHDPSYQGRCVGNVVSRDRASHNGSVYPWLLGAYVSAMLRVGGRGEDVRAEARTLLEPCLHYLKHQGAGQIPELFDGEAPHRPGGSIASARSAGELLRAYVEEILDQAPVIKSGSGLPVAEIILPARPMPSQPNP